MRFYYRVLSVDEKEHTFVVRYWSDAFSEQDLKMRDDDHEDPPLKCRTDYNLTAWRADMTADELHEHIVQSAPKQWFEVRAKGHEGETPSMAAIKEFVNINKDCHLTVPPINDSNK